MKRPLRVLLLLLLSAGLAAAQTAVVKRNVNLRPDPSTDKDPIAKLTPGTQIQLLDPGLTNGFLHAQVDDQTGWAPGHDQRRVTFHALENPSDHQD